jgi:hypothetical protein
MNPATMRKRALAIRDAHSTLLDLKRLVDDATVTARAAELEAVSLAISPRLGGDALRTLRVAIEHLQSANFEATLSQAREKLETAVAWHYKETTNGQ